jgi:hypothetical protein
MNGLNVFLGTILFAVVVIALTLFGLLNGAPRCVPGRHPYDNVTCNGNGFWDVNLPEDTKCR